MRRHRLVYLIVFSLAGLAPSTAVADQYPGVNGRIAVVRIGPSGDQIATVDPGTGDLQVVLSSQDRFFGDLAFSPDGQRIAFLKCCLGQEQNAELFVMGADGADQVRVLPGVQVNSASWSPDGERFVISAYVGPAGHAALFVLDIDGGELDRISPTGVGYHALFPVWLPDATRIAYVEIADTGSRIVTIDPDGTDRDVVYRAERVIIGLAASPDGSELLFAREKLSPPVAGELFTLDVAGGGLTKLTDSPRRFEEGARFSPDGAKIVFQISLRGVVRIMPAEGGTGVGRTLLDDAGFYAFGPTWAVEVT